MNYTFAKYNIVCVSKKAKSHCKLDSEIILIHNIFNKKERQRLNIVFFITPLLPLNGLQVPLM